MNILSPSILSIDFANIERDIKLVLKNGVKYIHLDVMDGMFVPNISFGQPVIKAVRKVAPDAVFDVHLMIEEPIRYIDTFKDAGADILTVHAEAVSDMNKTIEAIREAGMKPSIAISPETGLDALMDYVSLVDMILIMTVRPGYGGQKLIPETLNKVRELRDILNERGIEKDIEVDGGVTVDNLSTVLESGANVIVAGSSVFGGDIEENVRNFRKILG